MAVHPSRLASLAPQDDGSGLYGCQFQAVTFSTQDGLCLGRGLEARRGQMTTLKTLHAAALGAALLVGTGAFAQERSPGLLDNLFNRGEATQQREAQGAAASELSVRLDRLENRLREMTGQIEQLQFRNQQLEQEIARLQGGAPAV